MNIRSQAWLPEPDALCRTLQSDLPQFGQIQWQASTGSTNADLCAALRGAHAPLLDTLPWLHGAHLQTAGKGRAGRSWANQPGQCLMFSVALPAMIPIASLMGLPPALGVAATLALRGVVNATHAHRLTLKWPNDILWDDAKLAGILIETVKHPDRPHPIVVAGIGLNLSGASALGAEIGRLIADWSQACLASDHTDPQSLNGAVLVRTIAQAWQHAITAFAEGGFGAFRQAFDNMDALAGHDVAVIDQGRVLMEGVAEGCDTTGRLMVLTRQGCEPVMVGDVSVRAVAAQSGSDTT